MHTFLPITCHPSGDALITHSTLREFRHTQDVSSVTITMQANAVSDKILDLRMCDYTGKNLSGKVLSGALLKDATLPNSILRETVLTKVCQTYNHDAGCMFSMRLAKRPCCLSAIKEG